MKNLVNALTFPQFNLHIEKDLPNRSCQRCLPQEMIKIDIPPFPVYPSHAIIYTNIFVNDTVDIVYVANTDR